MALQVYKCLQDSSPGLVPYLFEDVVVAKNEISLSMMILIYFNGLISIDCVLEWSSGILVRIKFKLMKENSQSSFRNQTGKKNE